MADVPEGNQTEGAYALGQTILKAVADWYQQQIENHPGEDPLLVTRMGILAMSQYAAILAVDTGMTEEQFVEIIKINFKEAYDKAPKFG